MLDTPYGRAELVKINWCYGVKVRLPGECLVWFAFWEVSL